MLTNYQSYLLFLKTVLFKSDNRLIYFSKYMIRMHEKLTVKTFLGILSNHPFYAKKVKDLTEGILRDVILEPADKNINEVPEVSYPKSYEKIACH